MPVSWVSIQRVYKHLLVGGVGSVTAHWTLVNQQPNTQDRDHMNLEKSTLHRHSREFSPLFTMAICISSYWATVNISQQIISVMKFLHTLHMKTVLIHAGLCVPVLCIFFSHLYTYSCLRLLTTKSVFFLLNTCLKLWRLSVKVTT